MKNLWEATDLASHISTLGKCFTFKVVAPEVKNPGGGQLPKFYRDRACAEDEDFCAGQQWEKASDLRSGCKAYPKCRSFAPCHQGCLAVPHAAIFLLEMSLFQFYKFDDTFRGLCETVHHNLQLERASNLRV